MLTCGELVQRVARHMEDRPGWRQGPLAMVPPDVAGQADLHLSFAVLPVESAPISPVESARPRRTLVGGITESRIEIVYHWRLPVEWTADNLAAALDEEGDAIRHLLSLDRVDLSGWHLVRRTREPVGDGTFLRHRLTFAALHLEPIQEL